MQEDKIETFLTQVKSLDALALSIVEELKMCQLKNEMLQTNNTKLEEDLRLARAELSHLKDAQDEPTDVAKPKAKKVKSKAVEPDAPTLF